MAEPFRIEQPDLRSVVRELRRSPERLDKVVRLRFRALAADIRDKARTAAAGQHPHGAERLRTHQPQHWSDLVKSIQSGAQSDAPYVQVGSARVPWALGFEFGSLTHRQFPKWQGNGQDAGYFLWPSIRGELGHINDEMVAAMEEAISGFMGRDGADAY